MPRSDFLLSSWPWRSAGYLLTGVLTGAATLVGIVITVAAGSVLALVLVGLPLLLLAALSGIPVTWVERHRLRLIDRDPAPDRHRVPEAGGLRSWLTTRLREPVTWRELGYALLFAGLLWPVDALAITVALLAPLSMATTPLLMATAA